MKDTGIVRRVDMLGRVVVPKEIRTVLKIDLGDSMEIYTDKDSIVLKKYYPIKSLGDSVYAVAKTLSKFTGHEVLVSDENLFVAGEGKLAGKYVFKEISEEIKRLIFEDKILSVSFSDGGETLPITRDEKAFFNQLFFPIKSGGKAIGLIILLNEDKDRRITEQDVRLASLCSELISSAI